MPCVRALLLLPVLIITIACGGDPPEKEIEQARGAIGVARAAGAERYAAAEFSAAVSALENADAAVALRDYRLALNHALDSKERAENAIRETTGAMAAERSRAEGLVQTATDAMTSAQEKLKAAEAARAPARVLTTLREEIADADARLQEARAALERKDYATVTSAAEAAAKGLAESLEALEAATTPPGRRRR